jgi:hypothetical protein
MDRRQLVGYCGIYCGLCDQHTRIPDRATALAESLHKADFEEWGHSLSGFQEFWSLLNQLKEVEDDRCCRTGKCGAPFCAARKCAIERQVEVCPHCQDYPCERLRAFAKGEPLLLADGQRMVEIGLDAWVEEQEARREAGFCYADIRCYPYYYPRE